MEGFGSYGQKTTVQGSLTTPDGAWSLNAQIDMSIDTTNNLSGNVHLIASGNADGMSGSLDAWADIIVASWSLYIQPHLTNIPTDQFSDEQNVGFQLMNNKWLEVPGASDTLTPSTINPLHVSKQLVEVIKQNPVFLSTKQFERNGYDIHLLALHDTWVQELVAGIVNTIMTPLGLPAEMTLWLPSASDLNVAWVRTYGVVGKKGDETKLGFIVKHAYNPEYLVLTSTTTSITSKLQVRLLEKRMKYPTTEFMMETTTPSPAQQNTTVSLLVPTDGIDLSAQINTLLYDAGNTSITAPTGAILIDSFGP